MYNAFLTSLGPSFCRGALWESAGVGKAESAGRLEVKLFDFGMSANDEPLTAVPFEFPLVK